MAHRESQDIYAGLLKFAGITAVFVVVGPLVGTVVFLTASAILVVIAGDVPHTGGPLQTIAGGFLGGILWSPFGYVFGLKPAVLAGILVGAAQVGYGRLPWPIVILIGAAVGAFDIFIGKGEAPLDLFAVVLPVVTCTVATLVCWAVVRNWHSERQSSEQRL
jgi:hypothetical protein